MVLPDRRAVLRLRGFAGHAGSHDLGEAVDVDGVDVEGVLDLLAHLICPRLSTADRGLQARRGRIDALLVELVEDREQVGRGGRDDVRLEVLDELHLARGLPAGDRDDGETVTLCAVDAETAGEQAVTVGIVHHLPAFAAGTDDGPRNEAAPPIEIAEGVADDRRQTRRARGGVDACDLVLWDGEESERVVVAEVLLVRERQLRNVVEARDVCRSDAEFVEGLPVEGHLLVHRRHRRLEVLQLVGAQLVQAHPFAGVEVGLSHHRLLAKFLSVPNPDSASDPKTAEVGHRIPVPFPQRVAGWGPPVGLWVSVICGWAGCGSVRDRWR